LYRMAEKAQAEVKHCNKKGTVMNKKSDKKKKQIKKTKKKK